MSLTTHTHTPHPIHTHAHSHLGRAGHLELPSFIRRICVLQLITTQKEKSVVRYSQYLLWSLAELAQILMPGKSLSQFLHL